MSKNLSLDIKTLYQTGLILTLILSGVLMVQNIFSGFALLKVPKSSPSLRIREQQLKQAISAIETAPVKN